MLSKEAEEARKQLEQLNITQSLTLELQEWSTQVPTCDVFSTIFRISIPNSLRYNLQQKRHWFRTDMVMYLYTSQKLSVIIFRIVFLKWCSELGFSTKYAVSDTMIARHHLSVMSSQLSFDRCADPV